MTRLVLVLVLVTLPNAAAAGQRPKLLTRLKGAVKAAVDTGVTKAAAAAVDTALGTGNSRLGKCPQGTGPTVGTAAVTEVKDRLKGTPDSAARPANCPVDTTRAAARSNQPAGSSGGTAALVAGAAPVAVQGVSALGGMLGGGPTRESMIKDLSNGRLELSPVRFIGASDALAGDVTQVFADLAEALQSIEGEFVLNLPPEIGPTGVPDSTMNRRRLAKLGALLAVAGIGDRLALESGPPGLDPGRKLPKVGEARVEILRRGAR
ncbi:MAG: hypothetical protein R2882_02270 [Gemmatimonadales bacterium]